MSLLQTSLTAAATVQKKKKKKDLGHRIRVSLAAASSILLVSLLSIYGASYYILPLDERPFSPKHELLKPSGQIGIDLGFLGTVLFFIIFLYALRKVIPFLGRWGTARHWMDFHVIAGVTAPVVIAFHASFKFRGIAGIAFWIMLAVAISGFVGRYLYAQIPRSLNAAELSLSELRENERELAEALIHQEIFSAERLSRALHVPTAEHIRRIGTLRAVGEMMSLDLVLPVRMASLRCASCGFGGRILSLGGLLSSGNEEIEDVIRLVRRKVSLSKRMVFLGQTQKVFHLWHVIHRPFSYGFAILAIIHIAVVWSLGFMSLGLR